MTDQVNEAFGHYFRDMAGNQHFHTGAVPPSFAHSEIIPLYTHPARGVVDEAEPGAVSALVAAVNATLAANPHDDTMWSLEAAVAPFNASKPAECASGCPPRQVCDYCQVASKHKSQAAAQPAVPSVPEVCTWTFDDDDYAPKWDTSCGEAYCFIEGGPEDSSAKFCHGCGKPISTATPKDQPAQGVG